MNTFLHDALARLHRLLTSERPNADDEQNIDDTLQYLVQTQHTPSGVQQITNTLASILAHPQVLEWYQSRVPLRMFHTLCRTYVPSTFRKAILATKNPIRFFDAFKSIGVPLTQQLDMLRPEQYSTLISHCPSDDLNSGDYRALYDERGWMYYTQPSQPRTPDEAASYNAFQQRVTQQLNTLPPQTFSDILKRITPQYLSSHSLLYNHPLFNTKSGSLVMNKIAKQYPYAIHLIANGRNKIHINDQTLLLEEYFLKLVQNGFPFHVTQRDDQQYDVHMHLMYSLFASMNADHNKTTATTLLNGIKAQSPAALKSIDLPTIEFCVNSYNALKTNPSQLPFQELQKLCQTLNTRPNAIFNSRYFNTEPLFNAIEQHYPHKHLFNIASALSMRGYMPRAEKFKTELNLLKANEFWTSRERHVQSHHFAMAKATMTGEHSRFTPFRDHHETHTINTTERTEHLWAPLQALNQFSQQLLSYMSLHSKHIQLRRTPDGEIQIKLYRGVGGAYAKQVLEKAKNKEPLAVAPIQSRTLDPEVARNFACWRARNESSPYACVVEHWHPLTSVMYCAICNYHPLFQTFHSEQEIVMYAPQGTLKPTQVTQIPAQTHYDLKTKRAVPSVDYFEVHEHDIDKGKIRQQFAKKVNKTIRNIAHTYHKTFIYTNVFLNVYLSLEYIRILSDTLC